MPAHSKTKIEVLEFKGISKPETMTSEFYEMTDEEDISHTRGFSGRAISDLTLPEVPPDHHGSHSMSHEDDFHPSDSLFLTYKKYLRQTPEEHYNAVHYSHEGVLPVDSSKLIPLSSNQSFFPSVPKRSNGSKSFHKVKKQKTTGEIVKHVNTTKLFLVDISIVERLLTLSFFDFFNLASDRIELKNEIGDSLPSLGLLKAGDHLIQINSIAVETVLKMLEPDFKEVFQGEANDALKQDFLVKFRQEVMLSDKEANTLIFHVERELKLGKICKLKGDEIDPETIHGVIEELGGFNAVDENKLWQNVREKLKMRFTTSSSHQLKSSYMYYFKGVLI
eukprot:maker-scaffold_7-snap-gene-7.36-mRNA-1 protein AED:0.00 eAED:0.00 QI:14/1/1/1/1/1/3/96/334